MAAVCGSVTLGRYLQEKMARQALRRECASGAPGASLVDSPGCFFLFTSTRDGPRCKVFFRISSSSVGKRLRPQMCTGVPLEFVPLGRQASCSATTKLGVTSLLRNITREG